MGVAAMIESDISDINIMKGNMANERTDNKRRTRI